MSTLRQAVQDYVEMRRGLGFKLRETEQGIDRFRRLPGSQRHAIHHHGAGPCLGSATVARAAFALGETAGLCPRIRPSSSCR